MSRQAASLTRRLRSHLGRSESSRIARLNVVSFLRSRMEVRARGYSNESAVCYLLHDPFDGVGTLTALRAAAEAVVNLAHPQPLSGLRKGGMKLLITEHVTRADDHDRVLTHISGHGRNEGKQNKATAPPPRVL